VEEQKYKTLNHECNLFLLKVGRNVIGYVVHFRNVFEMIHLSIKKKKEP